jgi:dTDP-glucose 4,6-dehydratase
MTTWLVTGGAGFIGGNFVLGAVRDGIKVVNLDALTYAGNRDTLASLDVTQPCIRAAISATARVAVAGRAPPGRGGNFAAESPSTARSTARHLHPDQCRRRWPRSRAAIGAMAKRIGFRFLHVSTDEVYGSLGDTGAFREDTPYAPNSPYSASKAASDHLVRAWHHTYGLPVLTTNCSNNYGPYQFPEKLVPLMIQKALMDQPLPVYGDGKNVRDWLYVLDHCRAIRTVLERGRVGEVYNVGGNAEMMNIDVVNTIIALVDQRRPRANGTARTAHHYVWTAPATIAATRSMPEDQARTRLAPRRDLRIRPREDRRLVPRPRRLGRPRHGRQLPRRAPGRITKERP